MTTAPAVAITATGPSSSVRRDLADRDDLVELLTAFYGKAFRDPLLGPVFVDIARMDLAKHLPFICDFWETVVFKAGKYRRNAFTPHQQLHLRAGLTTAHFARWLLLWCETVDEGYVGPRAESAKLQASRMAASMSRRITGEAQLS
ncbi:MAG TPA: group III truncated hemoglobin [Jatrophihabitantaceae bacterium]|nr:group III truncated hemoglobin [Jatrophihabitantaceae bacterium]